MLKAMQVLGFCGALVGSHIAVAATCDPEMQQFNPLTGLVKCVGDSTEDSLRTLGALLQSNGQFRKTLQDATDLLSDLAGN